MDKCKEKSFVIFSVIFTRVENEERGEGWKKARRSEAARTVAGIKSDKIITGLKWLGGLA